MEQHKVWLDGWEMSEAGGRIFEKILELALGVVEHYRSDLYHDAVWLHHNLPTETEFWVGLHRWGTSIGTERSGAEQRGGQVWHVYLSGDEKSVMFTRER
jgi:hypothetical protein